MMAKKKNSKFVQWLKEKIAKKEEIIMERNGLVPLDFDILARYLTVLSHYEEKKEVFN